MKTIFRTFLTLIFLSAGTALLAQNRAVLSYFEDNSGDFRIVAADGSDEMEGADLNYGDEVPIGWTVVTGQGDSAELMLDPNGTIIKLSENTNFSVEGLSGVDGGKSNDFALGFGKFRAVAARLTGSEQYNVRGRTTVCGVRGTDFGMTIEAAVEAAFVFGGQIEFQKIGTGLTIMLTDGQFADALAASFQPQAMSSSQQQGLEEELEFTELDPKTVQQTTEVVSKTDPEPEPEPEPEESSEGGMLDFLAGIIGLEIGSVTIGDETYAKAVITPTFSVGKMATSLYLPIIYKDDLFNPNDWYKPAGNNEWSFGTDQGTEVVDIAEDVVRDLALKIKYLQWGDQRDPFFFKLGNMSTFTVGHGLIMRNYANDAEFPAIRRVGLNLGMDFGKIGFEAFANDLADIEIVGGRLYLRPAPEAFPLAFGFTGIADLFAAEDTHLILPTGSSIGDPILLNVGVDLDYPLIERDAMTMVLFGDIAGMMPYYRDDGTGIYAPAVESGLQTDFVFGDTIKNYGLISGVLGNVGPLDYRAEWRYFTGAFIPSIFDNIYDKQRTEYSLRTAEYSRDPSQDEFQGTTMGIYGEAGYTWEKIFSFQAGYFWPFVIADGKLEAEDRDYLHLAATLEQGVIPVVDIGISVAYDRWYFLPMLFQDKAGTSFFDANTTVKTIVTYGVSQAVDLVLIGTTTLARDEDGNILYDSDNRAEIATTISIETQIHF